MKAKTNSQMFIGRKAAFSSADSKLEGEVVAETKNTFRVRTKDATKTLLKSKYDVHINGKTINGSLLVKNPEDRIKGA